MVDPPIVLPLLLIVVRCMVLHVVVAFPIVPVKHGLVRDWFSRGLDGRNGPNLLQ